MDINLHAAPYALGLDQGYNQKGEVYDIEVLNTSAVLGAWDKHCEAIGVNPWSHAAVPLFKSWCNSNNVYYYGAPRDDFFPSAALDAAANACATFLLMEDLS